MTIASKLTTINTALSDIKTAIVNKGQTPTGDITTFATAIGNISGGGGTSAGTTDVPLTRISDDSGNEIGTHYMNFEDGNGNVYKVVCLDAQYRKDKAQMYSNKDTVSVTNMPEYNKNHNLWWYDCAKETATTNTQLFLNFCSANSHTSEACSHCRSKSFTIGGTTYYGQLPNMREVFDMWRHRVQIETMDTSASSNTLLNFSSLRNIVSSNQFFYNFVITLTGSGLVYGEDRYNYEFFVCPVLEIPLNKNNNGFVDE